jgi:hypothetical protein
MQPRRRLVVVDPGFAAPVGHHVDVNTSLAGWLSNQGWAVEIWADAAASVWPELASSLPGLRPQLREAGYIDPRHWSDLAGTLHQAGLLHTQLEQCVSLDAHPVQAWLAHSLVPFQLIALARLLQRQPPASVLISLMFAPSEVFGGQVGLDLQALRHSAEDGAAMALSALALACRRSNHRLQLACGSQQLQQRYAPLCQAAGLAPPLLHPALCGLATDELPPSVQGAPLVLLHWGERKPDKGRELGLEVLEHLLSGAPLPAGLGGVRWCFHASSREPAPDAERELLRRAGSLEGVEVLEGQQPRNAMLDRLAGSAVVLLPYDPVAYAERSSGVLWLYGAARHRIQQPSRVVGYGGGWLGREVPDLGLHWQELSPQGGAQAVLSALARALEASAPNPQLTPYGREVLGGMPFSQWACTQLQADSLNR